jgi:hypothetical protein
MKWSRLGPMFLLLLAIAVAAASIGMACGPQEKFCPNTKTGECPLPALDSGQESQFIGDDAGLGDATFIGGDT